jgi:hypothetical protein
MQQWRKIYGSILECEELGYLPIQIRNLYIGTILIADDDGRFKASPRYIKAKIFPYDDFSHEQIRNWLFKLSNIKQLILYENDGEFYGYHPNWDKYNKVRDDRKVASNLPKPTIDNQVTTNRQPDDNQMTTKCQTDDGVERIEKKEKNRKEKIILHSGEAASKINHLINLFKEVNPSYKQIFKNKTQRACLDRLIKEHTYEKVEAMIMALPQIIGKKYAPRITTPYQLEIKLGDLVAFVKQETSQQPIVAPAFKKDEST